MKGFDLGEEFQTTFIWNPFKNHFNPNKLNEFVTMDFEIHPQTLPSIQMQPTKIRLPAITHFNLSHQLLHHC